MSKKPPILLLDGALGTLLEEEPYNITFSSQTPLWSSQLLIAQPDTLREIHHTYIDAGADVILTATYQASLEGFARTPSSLTSEEPNQPQDGKANRSIYSPSEATRYMRSAIPLVCSAFSASSRPTRVALSLGPYGATMHPVSAEYTGEYPPDMNTMLALEEWHSNRLRIYTEDPLTWDRIEFVGFETVRRADEVLAIRGAIQKEAQKINPTKGKKWWIAGVFPQEEVPEQDVRHWISAALDPTSENKPRPWGVGINCTRLENVERIVEIMEEEVNDGKLVQDDENRMGWGSASGRTWLVLYPDGTQGEAYDSTLKTWVKRGSEKITEPWADRCWKIVQRIRARNCWEGILLGGCCRTSFGDIRALRDKVDHDRTSS